MYFSVSDFFQFPSFIFEIINFALSLATLAVVCFKFRSNDKDGD